MFIVVYLYNMHCLQHKNKFISNQVLIRLPTCTIYNSTEMHLCKIDTQACLLLYPYKNDKHVRIHEAHESKPKTIALRSSTATEVTGVLRTR